MACRAFDIDVRQELHVERNRSRAVARRATQLASVIENAPLSDRWSAQHLFLRTRVEDRHGRRNM